MLKSAAPALSVCTMLGACGDAARKGPPSLEGAIAIARADFDKADPGVDLSASPYRVWESRKAWAINFVPDPDAFGGSYTAIVEKQDGTVVISWTEQ